MDESAGSIMCCCFLPVLLFLFFGLFASIRRHKKKQQLQKLFDEMRAIFVNVRKGNITKSATDRFFECADQALGIMPNKPSHEKMKNEVENMSNQISLLLAVRTPTASLGAEIDKLANLRQKGMISDLEFQAFSERFKLSTGEKASGIIKAISELSKQHRQGAMSEGNYHAALWALLDKIDRKT